MSAWYAVMCKPRQEALAETNLANQGYRVYLPRLATQSRRARTPPRSVCAHSHPFRA